LFKKNSQLLSPPHSLYNNTINDELSYP